MKQFLVGLENGDENRSVAWLLEYPGCFAYGPDPESALAAVPAAVLDYARWIECHTGQPWLVNGAEPAHSIDQVEPKVEETWQVYSINEQYELVEDGYAVNAWFRGDWMPLSEAEAQQGLQLLSWSREDLLETIQGLSPEALDQKYPGERWSIRGIVKHVGGAEWWYLDRLSLAFPRQDVPVDMLDRLEKVRRRLIDVLPDLAGSTQVVGRDGEFWSPRKLLRRALWHERDHTAHIARLLALESTSWI